MASGGALKPVKCLFYLISFEWDAQGKWRHAANENKEEFMLGVQTVDGSLAIFEHLGVGTAKETLGVFVCPNGTAEEQLKSIKIKAQDWIDRAKDSHFRRRDVWFLVDHHLWPKLSHSLCSVEAPWEKLEMALKNKWWHILPLGGVWCLAPKKLRQLDSGSLYCR